MTQVFDEKGDVHPITVLQAGPCVITQLKTRRRTATTPRRSAGSSSSRLEGHQAAGRPLRQDRSAAGEDDQGSRHRAPQPKARGRKGGRPRAGGYLHRREVCRCDRHLEGPRFCRRRSPSQFRRRSQVARPHVPGAGFDRRIVVFRRACFPASACRATWGRSR